MLSLRGEVTDPARANLARAVRDLIAATALTDAHDSMLDAAASAVERITATLTSGEPVALFRPTIQRNHAEYLPRSPAVGALSPIAPGTIDWHFEPDAEYDGRSRMIATGVLSAVYEGPPLFVHGGIVALIFDELLGMINIENGCPGMTGMLNIKYRRPTPLNNPLRWVAWITRIEGRRVESTAQLWHGETLCAQAEGVFIQPKPATVEAYFNV